MAGSRFAIAAALAASLFLLTAAGCAPYRVVEDGRLNLDAVNSVVRKTANIRGLPLKKSLPVELVDAEQVRSEVYASLADDAELDKLRAFEILLKKLHLLEAEIDLVELVAGMLTEQVAGYYDAEKDVMRLVRGNMSMGGAFTALEDVLQRDLSGEFLLAHELTHALADQHFDLVAYLEETENTDAASARKAFVEGEAMLVGMHYLMRKPMKKVAFSRLLQSGESATESNAAEAFEQIPDVIKREIVFLYVDGFSFASALYRRGGTDGLNRAYGRPPRSSEEILHPEKYIEGNDPPVRVELPDDQPGMQGLVPVDEDTMGEIGIQALLVKPLGEEGARVTAEGWGGDRFRLYRDPNDPGRVGFVWRTVWDTEADREEFGANLAQAMRRAFVEVTTARNDRWDTPEGVFLLEVTGEREAEFRLLPN